MFKRFLVLILFVFLAQINVPEAFAQSTPVPRKTAVVSASPSASPSESPTPSPTPTAEPRPDLTEKTSPVVEPLKKLIEDQHLGPALPFNPVKYAIRGSVNAGVPVNTIVLLLLLPGIAALIAAVRHFIGIRGFGLLMPAALSIVFLAIGPFIGVLLFLIIVIVSILVRFVLRKTKLRMQYLPRMAMLILFVVIGVLGILFTAPIFPLPDLINVSIFPVLFLVILAEDFTRLQLGKSARIAIKITTETLILALVSYFLLTLRSLHEFVLLNPEGYLIGIMIFDFVLGRYVGLRLLEYWRFRKLISS